MTQAAPAPVLAPVQAPSALPAPAAPATPGAPATRAMATVNGERLITAADVAALKERKGELSRLLNSASSRRSETQEALRGASPGADRAGLEQRLGVLDARIARLEQEIDENSSQLASVPALRLNSSTRSADDWGPPNMGGKEDAFAPIGIALVVFVLGPLAFAISRGIWKRGSRPVAEPRNADTTQRLERIEQGMDAIAIEIERVSEGQRFVTRLMSEGKAGALGAGQAAMEPIRVGQESLVERR